MKSKKRNWIAAVALLGFAIAGARAEDAPLDVDQRLKILERKYEIDQEAAAAKVKETPVVTANGKDGFSIKSPDGGFALRVGGFAQADARFYLADKSHALTDTFAIRRARIILEGVLGKHYEFKFVPDFGGGTVSLVDAYVDARFWDGLRFRFGKFKEAFGLEQYQSDTNNMFIERSLATNLVPNRDVGVQVFGDLWKGALTYQIGAFNGVPDSGSADVDNGDNKDFAARIFAQPFKNGHRESLREFGVGVAGTKGKRKGTGINTAGAVTLLPVYRTEGLNPFFTYRPLDTVADGNLTRFSPQLYWYAGRAGLLAEYVVASEDVKRATTTITSTTLDHRAWQVAASFILTGENASFNGVKPRRPFNPKNGGWGAWEVAARVSALAVDEAAFPRYADPAKSAQAARAYTGGVNWYASSNVRVTSNYTYTRFDKGGAPDRPIERAIVSRVQFVF